MAPGLNYLFTASSPHHYIITSTHVPAEVKKCAPLSAPLQSTVPKVTPTDLAAFEATLGNLLRDAPFYVCVLLAKCIYCSLRHGNSFLGLWRFFSKDSEAYMRRKLCE